MAMIKALCPFVCHKGPKLQRVRPTQLGVVQKSCPDPLSAMVAVNVETGDAMAGGIDCDKAKCLFASLGDRHFPLDQNTLPIVPLPILRWMAAGHPRRGINPIVQDLRASPSVLWPSLAEGDRGHHEPFRTSPARYNEPAMTTMPSFDSAQAVASRKASSKGATVP